MIDEDTLNRRARNYTMGVMAVAGISPTDSRKASQWIRRVVHAAYSNGFQSGVVWHMEQKSKERKK